MESFLTFLRDWNKSTNERVKLQYSYVVLVVTIVVLAGLVTLLNAKLGHEIVSIGGFLFLAMIANAVIWALLKSFVLDKLTTRARK